VSRDFRSVLETESDLRVAEPVPGRIVVQAAGALAQGLLDLMTEGAAGAFEITGDAGFVLAELAPDFGKGMVRGVIEAEALFVTGLEQSEGNVQSAAKMSEELGAVGVVEACSIVSSACGWMGRCFHGGREVGGDMTMRRVNFGKAAAGAQGVDVALREGCPQPAKQRSAA